MEDSPSLQRIQALWTSDPFASEETIRQWSPITVTWAGIVEEEPRYIRSINVCGGAIIQIVTTQTQRRGYIPRGVNDYLLCEIHDQEGHEQVKLAFAGVCKTIEDADAWIGR